MQNDVLEILKNLPSVAAELAKLESAKVESRRNLIVEMNAAIAEIDAELKPTNAKEASLNAKAARLKDELQQTHASIDQLRERSSHLRRKIEITRRAALRELERTADPRLNALHVWAGSVRNAARMAVYNSTPRAFEGDGDWLARRSHALDAAVQQINAECKQCCLEAESMRREAVDDADLDAFITKWVHDLNTDLAAAGIKAPPWPL